MSETANRDPRSQRYPIPNEMVPEGSQRTAIVLVGRAGQLSQSLPHDSVPGLSWGLSLGGTDESITTRVRPPLLNDGEAAAFKYSRNGVPTSAQAEFKLTTTDEEGTEHSVSLFASGAATDNTWSLELAPGLDHVPSDEELRTAVENILRDEDRTYALAVAALAGN